MYQSYLYLGRDYNFQAYIKFSSPKGDLKNIHTHHVAKDYRTVALI